MPLADLFGDDGVVQYVSRNLDRSAFRSDHWTFLHIPKTAGSSFREEIANAIQPDYNVEVDYTSISTSDIDRDFSTKLGQALNTYVDHYFDRTKFVSGHISYRDIAQYPEFARSKIVTMLRHPVSRLHSDYVFRTSQENPIWQAELQRYPTFQNFFEAPLNQNTMFEFLCESSETSVEDTISFMLNRYTFIGVQEMYSFSIKALFMLFGQRIEPQIRLRVRTEEEDLPAITAQQYKAIIDLNKRDFEIYSFFLKKHQSVKNQLVWYSDYDRIFKKLNGIPLIQ